MELDKNQQTHLKGNSFKCLTLNYGGILNNPFQFYCHNFLNQLTTISNIFEELIKNQYYKDSDHSNFQFRLGKIDRKIRKGRYSPCFELSVGQDNNKFITRQQFQAKWDEALSTMIKQIKIQFTQEERINTRTFDLIYYHALLRYVYGNQPFEKLISQNPTSYCQKLKQFYDQSFLDQNKKVQFTCEGLNKLDADIIFLQQYDPLILKAYQQRQDYITKSCAKNDKLTIIRKGLFNKIQEYTLFVHEGIHILQADNYLIINVHLASKPKQNVIQMKQLQNLLAMLRLQKPTSQIIVGGDFNSFLSKISQTNQSINKLFYAFPAEQGLVTTIKMRTMAQPQYAKGNKLIKQSKDKIISTLEIKKASVMLINGEQIKNQIFLPSNHHPFDHFVVFAILAVKNNDQQK